MKKTLVGFFTAVVIMSLLCCQAFAVPTLKTSGTTKITLNNVEYTCYGYAYTDNTRECGYTVGRTQANVARTHTAVYVRFKTVSDGEYLTCCSMVDRGQQTGDTQSLYTNCPYDVEDFIGIRGSVIFRGTLSKSVELKWGR